MKYYAKLKRITPPAKEWLTNLSGNFYWNIEEEGLLLGEYLITPVSMKRDASAYTLDYWNRHGVNDRNADFVPVEEVEE